MRTGKRVTPDSSFKLTLVVDRRVYELGVMNSLANIFPDLIMTPVTERLFILSSEDKKTEILIQFSTRKIRVSSINNHDVGTGIKAFQFISEFVTNSKDSIIGFTINTKSDTVE